MFLRRAAERAKSEVGMFGWLLAQYQEQEQLSDEDLAAELEATDGLSVVRLALCGQPRPDADFQREIKRIAERVGVSPFRLAALVRRAQTLASWRDATGRDVRAARRHEEDEEP
jgi:hypothetical protein